MSSATSRSCDGLFDDSGIVGVLVSRCDARRGCGLEGCPSDGDRQARLTLERKDQAARIPHAFVPGPSGPGRRGPPDETCEICRCDPRNVIHRQACSVSWATGIAHAVRQCGTSSDPRFVVACWPARHAQRVLVPSECGPEPPTCLWCVAGIAKE